MHRQNFQNTATAPIKKPRRCRGASPLRLRFVGGAAAVAVAQLQRGYVCSAILYKFYLCTQIPFARPRSMLAFERTRFELCARAVQNQTPTLISSCLSLLFLSYGPIHRLRPGWPAYEFARVQLGLDCTAVSATFPAAAVSCHVVIKSDCAFVLSNRVHSIRQ